MVPLATNVEDSSTTKQTVNDNLELEEFDKILGRNTNGNNTYQEHPSISKLTQDKKNSNGKTSKDRSSDEYVHIGLEDADTKFGGDATAVEGDKPEVNQSASIVNEATYEADECTVGKRQRKISFDFDLKDDLKDTRRSSPISFNLEMDALEEDNNGLLQDEETAVKVSLDTNDTTTENDKSSSLENSTLIMNDMLNNDEPNVKNSNVKNINNTIQHSETKVEDAEVIINEINKNRSTGMYSRQEKLARRSCSPIVQTNFEVNAEESKMLTQKKHVPYEGLSVPSVMHGDCNAALDVGIITPLGAVGAEIDVFSIACIEYDHVRLVMY